ncbi:MAG: PilW family protein [Verrucomicrobiales bacterium]
MTTKVHPSTRGFTFIEVLVSMTIATGIMVLLLSLVGSGSGGYETAQREIRARTEGRGALHFIERDLESRVKGRTMSYAEDAEGGSFSSDELGFLCLKPESAQDPAQAGGELCYVRYYTAMSADAGGGSSRKLYRQMLSSGEVFGNVPEDPKDPYPAPPTDPATDELMALNVMQFEARFLARNGAGDWIDASAWEAEQAALAEKDREDFAPAVLELLLRVIDPQTARTMPAAEWNGGGRFGSESAVDPAAPLQSFSTRIPLK